MRNEEFIGHMTQFSAFHEWCTLMNICCSTVSTQPGIKCKLQDINTQPDLLAAPLLHPGT